MNSDCVLAVIYVGKQKWDLFTIQYDAISWRFNATEYKISQEKHSCGDGLRFYPLDNTPLIRNFEGWKSQISAFKVSVKMNGHTLSYFVRLLKFLSLYRKLVVQHLISKQSSSHKSLDLHSLILLKIHLVDVDLQIIDKLWYVLIVFTQLWFLFSAFDADRHKFIFLRNWFLFSAFDADRHKFIFLRNERLTRLVGEYCELDHAMSWLSTLGGAFSALGDYYLQCAETAGQISLQQFKLALRLGDPNTVARCRLFAALSLMQTLHLKAARQIISKQYQAIKNGGNGLAPDTRLIRMCQGCWAKLRYEYQQRRYRKQNPKALHWKKVNK